MPQAKIPFHPNQESGWESLAGASPVAMNVVIDGKGAVRRRPGVTTYSLGSSSIDTNPIVGLVSTVNGDVFAASASLTGAMEVYKLVEGAARRLTNDTSEDVTAGSRPIWAETEALLLMAAGRGLYKIHLETLKLEPLGGSPPTPSHVVAHANRLLANDILIDKTKLRFSAPAIGSSFAGHEQWSVATTALGKSGYFTAEARPDPVVAVGENTNEVFVFGTTNFQTFGPDAQFVYSSTGVREFGCSAPLSVVRDDQSFAWVDHHRRIVHSNGRNVTVISDAIQQTINEMERVDDAYGFRVNLGPVDCLCWTFPSDGRTFAYQKQGGWSQWMGWSDAKNNFSPWIVTSLCFIRGSSDNVVGTSSGGIGLLDSSVFTDLGTRVPAFVETGYRDQGTDHRKHCTCVKLVLRRGETTSASDEPIAYLQCRDEPGAWQSPWRISLGRSGERFPMVELRSLGIYRRRQWRFSFHGTEDLTLVSATEEYEVLEN